MTTTRRFRANPVEYGIFGIVSAMFMYSLFGLLYDREQFQFTAFTPIASNPVSENRSTASAIPAFLSVTLGCEAMADQPTRSTKLLLNGTLCDIPGSSALEKASITNETNRFNATVFPDLDHGKFSTDYIPLATGRNVIRVEFLYKGGLSHVQSLSVERN